MSISQTSHLQPYKAKCPDAAEPIWILFQTRADTQMYNESTFQRGVPAGGVGTPCQATERLWVCWDSCQQPALPPQTVEGQVGRGALTPAWEAGGRRGEARTQLPWLPDAPARAPARIGQREGSACSGSLGHGPSGSSCWGSGALGWGRAPAASGALRTSFLSFLPPRPQEKGSQGSREGAVLLGLRREGRRWRMVPGPPSSWEVALRTGAKGGMGGEGSQPQQPVPGGLLIPGCNHFFCFLAGEEAGSG